MVNWKITLSMCLKIMRYKDLWIEKWFDIEILLSLDSKDEGARKIK